VKETIVLESFEPQIGGTGLSKPILYVERFLNSVLRTKYIKGEMIPEVFLWIIYTPD